jgi:malic enzyme
MDSPQFTTMQYNNRQLIIKTIKDRNPFVIAECYLPGVAAQICELLTDAAKNESTLDNTQKGEIQK